MITAISLGQKALPVAVAAEPFISILLPFEPKITGKVALTKRLEAAVGRVKDELDRHYEKERTHKLMLRLRNMVSALNFTTYKKSIALYLSDTVEKVFYLDIEVNERISVNGPITMRDLIRSKKEALNYLLMSLSAERVIIFHGTEAGLRRILFITPDSMIPSRHDLPERVANFSDPAAVREVMLDKFMRYADRALHTLMPAYPYPVIIMAAERTGGHFSKLTANQAHIAAFIHGNFEDASEKHLQEVVAPYLAQWQQLKQQHLVSRLDEAMSAGRLTTGVREVCREAVMQKGRLLVVEENFAYQLSKVGEEQPPAYLSDKVDEAIANVLESGGDVAFVEDGTLPAYKRIALVKYY